LCKPVKNISGKSLNAGNSMFNEINIIWNDTKFSILNISIKLKLKSALSTYCWHLLFTLSGSTLYVDCLSSCLKLRVSTFSHAFSMNSSKPCHSFYFVT
jgi:hypothetical protein